MLSERIRQQFDSSRNEFDQFKYVDSYKHFIECMATISIHLMDFVEQKRTVLRTANEHLGDNDEEEEEMSEEEMIQLLDQCLTFIKLIRERQIINTSLPCAPVFVPLLTYLDTESHLLMKPAIGCASEPVLNDAIYPKANEQELLHSPIAELSVTDTNSDKLYDFNTQELQIPINTCPRLMIHQDERIYTALFNNINLAKNGRISLQEWQRSLSFLGCGIHNNEESDKAFCSRLLNAFDLNQDGYVSLNEYSQVIHLLKHSVSKLPIIEDRVAFMKRLFGGSPITSAQFSSLMNSVYKLLSDLEIEYSDQIMLLFNKCDLDGDGVLGDNDLIQIILDDYHPLRGLGLFNFDPTRKPTLEIHNKLQGKHIGSMISFGSTSFHRCLLYLIGIRLANMDLPQRQQFIPSVASNRYYRNVYLFTLPVVPQKPIQSVKCYSPHVFRDIRLRAGMTDELFNMSLSIEQLIGNLLCGKLTLLSESITEGKSGSVFFSSHNGLLLCKTISNDEVNTCLKMLKSYHHHLIQYGNNSLLCKIFGLYTIEGTNIIIMNNAFVNPTTMTTFPINVTYDLKGSTVGRRTNNHGGGVYKDLDWKKQNMTLSTRKNEQLLNQIKADVQFLKSNDIIDYSLLVGIYDVLEPLPEPGNWATNVGVHQSDAGGLLSTDGNRLFFLGIIDILIPYNQKKMVEHSVKKVFQGEGVSVTDPNAYASRFINFVSTRVVVDNG